MADGICFICNIASSDCQSNISELKSQHSGTRIIEFIKKFFREVPPRRIIADETNFFCTECIIRINEYDYACAMAERIEQEFHEMLIKSEKNLTNKVAVSKKFFSVMQAKELSTKVSIKKTKKREEDPDYRHEDEGDTEDEDYNNFVVDDSEPEQPKNLKLTCRKCNITFPSLLALTSHKHDQASTEDSKRSRIQFEPHKCYECNEMFNRKVDLMKHIRSHKTVNQQKFKCQRCFYVLDNEAAYDEHCKLHENRSPYECVYCDKVLSKKGGLVKHMLIHSGEPLYQCHKCGKTFVHITSFESHMMAHDDIRKKKCPDCSKEFRSISHLNRHKRTHIGDKPFKCSVCDKRFAYSSNRKVHELQHSQGTDKIHICSFCGAAYSRKSKLREHLQKNHETLIPHTAIENDLDNNIVKGRSLGDSV